MGIRSRKGSFLARLENVDEASELAQLRLEKQRSDLTAAAYLQAENVAAWQAETQRGAGLGKRLAEVESYVKTLELRAPFEGVVQGRGLDNLTGEFVDRGHLFCTVGREGAKRIKLAIPQKQIDGFLGNAGDLKPVSSSGNGPPGGVILCAVAVWIADGGVGAGESACLDPFAAFCVGGAGGWAFGGAA